MTSYWFRLCGSFDFTSFSQQQFVLKNHWNSKRLSTALGLFENKVANVRKLGKPGCFFLIGFG